MEKVIGEMMRHIKHAINQSRPAIIVQNSINNDPNKKNGGKKPRNFCPTEAQASKRKEERVNREKFKSIEASRDGHSRRWRRPPRTRTEMACRKSASWLSSLRMAPMVKLMMASPSPTATSTVVGQTSSSHHNDSMTSLCRRFGGFIGGSVSYSRESAEIIRSYRFFSLGSVRVSFSRITPSGRCILMSRSRFASHSFRVFFFVFFFCFLFDIDLIRPSRGGSGWPNTTVETRQLVFFLIFIFGFSNDSLAFPSLSTSDRNEFNRKRCSNRLQREPKSSLHVLSKL